MVAVSSSHGWPERVGTYGDEGILAHLGVVDLEDVALELHGYHRDDLVQLVGDHRQQLHRRVGARPADVLHRQPQRHKRQPPLRAPPPPAFENKPVDGLYNKRQSPYLYDQPRPISRGQAIRCKDVAGA